MYTGKNSNKKMLISQGETLVQSQGETLKGKAREHLSLYKVNLYKAKGTLVLWTEPIKISNFCARGGTRTHTTVEVRGF